MVTVSNVVKKIIYDKPLLHEALARNIINFANLAEYLKPEIEKIMGQKVREQAIVMSLRRHGEKLSAPEKKKKSFQFNSEIVMKTGLADITFVKSPSLLDKLLIVYGFIDYKKGETLNVIQGNYEITIIVSEKKTQKLLQALKSEKVINVEKNLVSLSLSFTKDFLYTPGILAKVTQELLWENINIFENISTLTELIFVIKNKDSIRAYSALQRLVEGNK